VISKDVRRNAAMQFEEGSTQKARSIPFENFFDKQVISSTVPNIGIKFQIVMNHLFWLAIPPENL